MSWIRQRSLPLFGQVSLWVTLACCASLAVYFLTHATHGAPAGPRQWPVTVFSWLPDRILAWPPAQWAFAVVFYACAPLWALRRAVPWSAWLTAVGFTGTVALYVENHVDLTHTSHVACMVLWIHALWYTVEAERIRQATSDGTFWRTPLYPEWAYWLGVGYIGVFYGFSGWLKLLHSGPGWANGVSMQLWAYMWGDPASPFTAPILKHRWLAQALQAVTLLAEAGAPLALVSRRARVVLGILLIGFHIGAISVFRWGFHSNAVLIALYFLPVREWLGGSKPPESEQLETPRGA
jgi:hypothetical protein